MLIQNGSPTQVRRFQSPQTTTTLSSGSGSSSPVADGFTRGADWTASALIYGGSTLAGVGLASELVFKSLIGDEVTANAVSLAVGGLVGLGTGFAINKGFDKVGNAISKEHGRKISTAAKAGLLALAGGTEGAEMLTATVGIVAAGGVVGGGVGLVASKFKG